MRKVPAGTDNPLHAHSSELKNVLISGIWYTGADSASAKDFGPGSVVMMPAGWVHVSGCRVGSDCVFYQEGRANSISRPLRQTIDLDSELARTNRASAHAMHSDSTNDETNFGFSFRSRKTGEIEILHHGHVAATLRGRTAANFLAKAAVLTSPDAQQLMARLTGNYKRGNERRAARHPRNLK